MRIVTRSNLAVGWLPCQVRPPQWGLTVVVKGAFRLRPDGPPAPEETAPLLEGDLFHEEDSEKSPRYETDLAPYKPQTDLLLVGHAHAPGGQAVPALNVGFGVGGWRKTLSVFGDRFWTSDGGGARATEPRPFTRMALRYEQAYGGAEVPENPLGKGAAPWRDANGRQVWPLPNVVHPRESLGRPGEPRRPAGFAPLHRTWPQRRMTGTYDDDWLVARWPWFPDDFDWRHFNAAPEDQRLDTALRGDEALTLENLRSDQPTYRARLPGLRARAFLHEGSADTAEGPLHEVLLKLDTLWVDMDAERLVLLWRGHVPVSGPEFPEFAHVVVGEEPLSETPHPEAHYRRLLAEAVAAGAEEEETAPEPPPQPATAPEAAPSEDDDEDAALDKQIAGAFDQARAQFTKAGLDPTFLDRIEGGEDMDSVFAEMFPRLGLSLDDAQQHLDAQKEKTRQKLAELGFDPSLLDEEPEETQEEGPLTADAVEAKVRGGESLAGRDLGGLDLAGRELSGGDFAGASFLGARLTRARLAGANLAKATLTHIDLSGADLTGADLGGAMLNAARLTEATLAEATLDNAALKGAEMSRANLTGATLGEADLERARLAEAALDGADLTAARLMEAELTGASLAEAVLDGADLNTARLPRITAAGARFAGCRLADAVMAESTLDGADFSNADLDRASFAKASLAAASFAGARGEEVVFTGASMPKAMMTEGARLPRAQVRQVEAPGSLWTDCDLRGADFSFADLPGGDFSGANLEGAVLHAVDLREGRLSRANARGARLTEADLFRADLEAAELSDADLSGSNCFEAEFLDAAVNRRTRLTGANLGRSKLAGHAEGV